MLKFPVDGGIVIIRSTILISAECVAVTTSSKEILKEAEVRHESFKVALHLNIPDQEVAIGGTLSVKGRTGLCFLLKENLDMFAWQSSDMTRVLRSVAEHRLNIREGYTPARQKKRGQAPKRVRAIQVEDCCPIPEIDWKVESLYGYSFNCFLDAYKDYHQIQMAESDEDKTTFHTSHGVYCYTKMPSGLKNAGATYQRLIDKAFDSKVGQNIEVYVDDLVIKSHTEIEMLRDIDETFHTLQKINMKLNPKKCTFGAVEGMFLGYMISPKGIKPCSNKTEAVLRLLSPRTIKEMLADFLIEKPDEAPPDTSVVNTPQEPCSEQDCVNQLCALIKTCLGRNTYKKIIQKKEVATVVEEDGPTWMAPIMEYLKDRTLPDERKEASKLRIKARQYELLEGVLYRRSFLKMWLRTTVRGGQSHAIGILLSNHASRCMGYDTQMKGQVFDSRCRLFYEVDRGESRCDNHRQSGEEVRVGKHSVPLRPSRRSSLGQRNDASHAVDRGKLGPKWEGPYEVTEALRDGAYRLRPMEGRVLPRTHLGLYGEICQQNCQTPGSDSRHGYWDAVGSGMMSGTNPMGTTNNPAVPSFFSPAFVSRNWIFQQHLFFAYLRIFRIAYLGVCGDL
nr:reverse transcriptase domain-containing protein [Tanacetum cinerariifolium]